MCDELTAEHAIYLTKDGRISIAGLNAGNVATVARAIHAVTDGKAIAWRAKDRGSVGVDGRLELLVLDAPRRPLQVRTKVEFFCHGAGTVCRVPGGRRMK